MKRETSHWLEHRGDRNLIILTADGEVVWDDAAQRFDPSRTTAIPGPLLTYQKTEPLYVDLRWAGEPDAKLKRFPADLNRQDPKGLRMSKSSCVQHSFLCERAM